MREALDLRTFASSHRGGRREPGLDGRAARPGLAARRAGLPGRGLRPAPRRPAGRRQGGARGGAGRQRLGATRRAAAALPDRAGGAAARGAAGAAGRLGDPRLLPLPPRPPGPPLGDRPRVRLADLLLRDPVGGAGQGGRGGELAAQGRPLRLRDRDAYCGRRDGDAGRGRMSGAVTVIVPTALRQFAGGKEEVRLAGGTVGDVLTQLTGEYPDLKQHLYKDDGQLRNFVNVYLNDEDIRYLEKQQT